MPYNTEEKPYEDLNKLVKDGWRCGEPGCKGGVNVAWGGSFGYEFYILRCSLDIEHKAIMRHYTPSPYDIPGFNLFNLTRGRRKKLVQEYGAEKTKALDKYIGVTSLSKQEVREILMAVYPDAPEQEMVRAVLLCASYGLNPLMKHIFLIKFNRWNKGHTEVIGEDWVTVMGIKAKRLLSSRRSSYGYTDNTPRVMTEQEQRLIFGKVDDDRLWVITKGIDPATGATAVGYGFWLHKDKVHGTEKGNSEFNMASIRSESQMLDRLRPGEMPVGVDVIPEEMAEETTEGKTIIEAKGTVVEEKEPPSQSDATALGICPIHDKALKPGKSGLPPYCPTRVPGTGRSAGKTVWCKGKATDVVAPTPQPELISEDVAEPGQDKRGEFEKEGRDLFDEAVQGSEPAPTEEAKPLIDMDWLKESLETLRAKKPEAWTESNVVTYMRTAYAVVGETVVECATKLDQGRAAHFVNKIQEALAVASGS